MLSLQQVLSGRRLIWFGVKPSKTKQAKLMPSLVVSMMEGILPVVSPDERVSMKRPVTASGDGVFAKGDKVTPELMNSMFDEFGNILKAAGLSFDDAKGDQLIKAIEKRIAAKAVTRTIRATLSGGIFETSTRVPWYPPADALQIASVRLQVATAPPIPVVVVIDIAGVKTRYTLPTGQLTEIFKVDLDISDSKPVNIAIETTGGENLIVTMDYQ